MDIGKVFANAGVERNKSPLKNKIYEVDIVQLKSDSNPEQYEQYRFKDQGYLVMSWGYEGKREPKYYHGFVTPEELRLRIGEKQYCKFCQGKRSFIVQRRENGRNVPKVKKPKLYVPKGKTIILYDIETGGLHGGVNIIATITRNDKKKKSVK